MSLIPRPSVCGHRGHCIDAPENTLAAFAAAADVGGDRCEIDTVLSKDGEIVVLHDLLLDRTTNGHGAAADRTAAEIAALDAGSWFGARFAGEQVPTLRAALAFARSRGMTYEVEIKERRNTEAYLERLKDILSDPADRAICTMISFDHASLLAAKRLIPDIKTGGIVLERYPDPVALARMSELDELCIDLDPFTLEAGERLKHEGIAMRVHAYSPAALEKARQAGLGWEAKLAAALEADLLDIVSSDDVRWAAEFARMHPPR